MEPQTLIRVSSWERLLCSLTKLLTYYSIPSEPLCIMTDLISLNTTMGLKFREDASSSLAEPLRLSTIYLEDRQMLRSVLESH